MNWLWDRLALSNVWIASGWIFQTCGLLGLQAGQALRDHSTGSMALYEFIQTIKFLPLELFQNAVLFPAMLMQLL